MQHKTNCDIMSHISIRFQSLPGNEGLQKSQVSWSSVPRQSLLRHWPIVAAASHCEGCFYCANLMGKSRNAIMMDDLISKNLIVAMCCLLLCWLSCHVNHVNSEKSIYLVRRSEKVIRWKKKGLAILSAELPQYATLCYNSFGSYKHGLLRMWLTKWKSAIFRF